MSTGHDPWTIRDELTHWAVISGLVVLYVLLAFVRFALAVVVRVIEVGTSLVCIIAVAAFALWLVTG